MSFKHNFEWTPIGYAEKKMMDGEKWKAKFD